MINTERVGNTERNFYARQLARKQNELADVEADLETAITKSQETKFQKKAKQLLDEIKELEKQLYGKDESSINPHIKSIVSEQKLRKIDFSKARSIASKLKDAFTTWRGGCALLLLQDTNLLMGEACLYEMLSIVFEDKLSEEVFLQRKSDGSCKVYEVDVASVTTEETKLECLKQLLKFNGQHGSYDLKSLGQQFTQSLCDSLASGDCVLIRIKGWISIEPQSFLEWFTEEFWKLLVDEIDARKKGVSKLKGSVPKSLGYVKVIAVLESSGQLPSGTLSQVTVCKIASLTQYHPLKIPLEKWKPKDVEQWFSEVKNLDLTESQRRAEQIVRDNKGYPRAICSILKEQYSA